MKSIKYLIRLPEFCRILNTRTWILATLYFLTGILYIMLPAIPVSIPPLAVKALIIPVLIILFKVTVRNENTISHWLIFAALFFSWAGDVALGIIRHQETMFMLGLVCFLLTHVLYVIVFFRTPGRNLPPKKFLYSVIPVLLYGLVLLYILYDDLGEMKIPVIIYTTVILAMVSAAINRIEKVNRTSFYLVLIGAVLFLSSDSMLAIDKFSHPFQFASPMIMFTYIAGQFLIVMGYIRQRFFKPQILPAQ
jgi:uncharacterized membrane protein YhhN